MSADAAEEGLWCDGTPQNRKHLVLKEKHHSIARCYLWPG